jgi:Na+-transporting methylmalonyl-CoA/oxaloacetate decarboxylase gamma subunit
MDILFLGLAVIFFLLSLALVRGCSALQRRP